MIYDEDKDLDTAKELVDLFLYDPLFSVGHIFDATAKGLCDFVFRGQARKDWDLIPTAHRLGDPLNGFILQTPGPLEKWSLDLRMYLGLYLHAEMRAVFMFLEMADRLGISTPLNYRTLFEHYELINAALQQKDYDYSEAFPSEALLEGIALAQHHGVPTRLLDWSESPFVAAFFAAFKASSLVPDNERVRSDKISVVCLNTRKLGNHLDLSIASAPRSVNNFLRIQRGIFLYIPRANQCLLSTVRRNYVAGSIVRFFRVGYAEQPVIPAKAGIQGVESWIPGRGLRPCPE